MAVHRRRVPDDPLPRGATATTSATSSGVDVDRAAALLQNHKVFISSGHDEYWSAHAARATSRPRATPASTSRSSAATRCSGRRAGSRAPTAPARRTARWSPTRTRTSPTPPGPGRVDRAPGATRASRRRRTASRPENALTGQSFVVNSGTSRDHRARRLQQPADVAQHRGGEPDRRAERCTLAPDTLGYEWDVDADNGFRPPGAVRAVVDDRQRRRGLHRLRQHDARSTAPRRTT